MTKYLSFPIELWNRYWFRPASHHPLLLYRFLIFFIGPIYIYLTSTPQPPSFFDQWQPISFYQLLNGPLNESLLAFIRYSWIAFSIAAGLNVYFSITAKVAALCAIVYLGHHYNFGRVYHSTHLYIMIMSILSFSWVDRKNEMSAYHRWPIAFCLAYVTYVMFFCGLQKLYYGNGLKWVFSESFYLRLLINPYSPPLNQWMIQSPLWVSQAVAFWGVIITEVCTPLFLFRKSTRYIIFLIWTAFHIMVMLSFGSHKLFVTQVLCYFAVLPMEDWSAYKRQLTDKLLRSPRIFNWS